MVSAEPFLYSVRLEMRRKSSGKVRRLKTWLYFSNVLRMHLKFRFALPGAEGALPHRVRLRLYVDFDPHSPCGERHCAPSAGELPRHISIHTSLAGSDERDCCGVVAGRYFNLRSPRGERHLADPPRPLYQPISIHAPLAGSDSKNSQKAQPFLWRSSNLRRYHFESSFFNRLTVSFSYRSVKKRSAKSPAFLVCLYFASKRSAHPQDHRKLSPQNARSCFHSGSQGNKTADYPSPGP